ncbi:MAG: ABC transporter permease [Rubricella sp.]
MGATTALVLREIEASGGRTPGGYAWAVVEPVAVVLLLTFTLGAFFEAPPVGPGFALFFASGYLPFALYVDVSARVAASIRFSKPLMAYRPVGPVQAILARFMLAALTQIVVCVPLLASAVATAPAPVWPDWTTILAGFAIMAALAFAFGALTAAVAVHLPLWERLWAMVNRPLLLFSAVIYTVEDAPERWAALLVLNPLVHGIGLVRAGLFDGYGAHYVQPHYPVLLALCALLFALAIFAATERDRLMS